MHEVLNYRGVSTGVNDGPVAAQAATGNTGSAHALRPKLVATGSNDM
jgi:hypothetical protein